jgi:putative transposase
MVLPDHPGLSIGKQCKPLGISRSAWYRPQSPESGYNLELMRVMDELFLQMPYLGSRQMRSRLRRLGYADITYIPMRRGFLYLVAVMDWYGRKAPAWRLSNTLESDFRLAALEDALTRYGAPEVRNTDQGRRFTSTGFVALLQENGVAISMDGKGCRRDNIMAERLWRSLRYENICPHAYETGGEARKGIGIWLEDYNQNRGHSSLADYTPDEAYRGISVKSATDPRLGEIKAAWTTGSILFLLPNCPAIGGQLSNGIMRTSPFVSPAFLRKVCRLSSPSARPASHSAVCST